MMTMFTEPAERAKAMGVAGFVASGGGSLGVLLGGVLTDTLDWHWIFLVNIPIGIAVFVLVPHPRAGRRTGRRRRAASTWPAPCTVTGRADARGLRDRERQRDRAG